jgi:RsiW-degrading membrane proteinase PrsW (M82 family)
MTTTFTLALLLIVAIGPALFWLLYFYQKDKYEPEPLSWIVKIFLLGALITIPIAVGESVAGIFFQHLQSLSLLHRLWRSAGSFLL